MVADAPPVLTRVGRHKARIVTQRVGIVLLCRDEAHSTAKGAIFVDLNLPRGVCIEDICEQHAVTELSIETLARSTALNITTIEAHLVVAVVHTLIYTHIVPILDGSTLNVVDAVAVRHSIGVHIGPPPLTAHCAVNMLIQTT